MGNIEEMNKILADLSVLYQKLRNYHWNLKGRGFLTLHKFFEDEYEKVKDEIDEVAEKIVQHGGRPYSTMKEYIDNAALKEDSSVPASDKMVGNVVADYEAVVKMLRKGISSAGDIAVEDMLTGILQHFEKSLWMLSSTTKD